MTIPPILFVSGIDTNIGKTFATAFLAQRFSSEGSKVITQKMIQTGCIKESEDILEHRRLLGQSTLLEDKEGLTCPYIFSYPASPHLAAEKDGRTIDLSHIDECTKGLLQKGYDSIVLEGAGGLMVPIHRDYLTLDFIADRHYPLALVTSGRLGSLNHTLMSLELCYQRGVEVLYVIYNEYPSADKLIEQDTYDYLDNYLQSHHPHCCLLRMPALVCPPR
ncbi:ATP-dependent dethiobiotin synthetase BioD [Porphyromonas crevioricanis]|uniref:dethiobiotin synthase n=1 Tax=Porphyromonas crevioricanis TaxID=393921 RepID=UPI00052E0A61|nr:dethiobiotin synthase [Porphyromonas crevioricanis]KGN90956.1 ATP-dependent dethiobiotin synthetase BioD [Porphyromonas crevioricanis]